jgi:hypothetical protein
MREDKKMLCVGARERGKESIVKLYSWFLAGARDLLNNLSFFLLIIGFKGCKLI